MFILCWVVSAVEKNKKWKGIGFARGILNWEEGSGKAWWKGDFSHKYEGGEGAIICLGLGVGGLAAGRRASAKALMMWMCLLDSRTNQEPCVYRGASRGGGAASVAQAWWLRGAWLANSRACAFSLRWEASDVRFFLFLFFFPPSFTHLIPFFFTLTRFLFHKIFLSLPFLRSFLVPLSGSSNNENFSKTHPKLQHSLLPPHLSMFIFPSEGFVLKGNETVASILRDLYYVS